MGLILLSLPRADRRGRVKCQLKGGPGGALKAAGIWGQAGGGARVPTGAGHLLSRQNMKGCSVLIRSQEEVKRRRTKWRRESAKKLLAWPDFAVAAVHPGYHIPEENPPAYIPASSTEVDTPLS